MLAIKKLFFFAKDLFRSDVKQECCNQSTGDDQTDFIW